jgi:hypothetical protein
MNADDELLGFLAAAPAVAAANLMFGGALPDEQPDKCLAVVPRSGRRGGKKFGVVGIAYQYPRFEILVRGEVQDYQSGYDLALATAAKLGTVQAQTIGGGTALWHGIDVIQPAYKGEDKNRRPVFSVVIDGEREVA